MLVPWVELPSSWTSRSSGQLQVSQSLSRSTSDESDSLYQPEGRRSRPVARPSEAFKSTLADCPGQWLEKTLDVPQCRTGSAYDTCGSTWIFCKTSPSNTTQVLRTTSQEWHGSLSGTGRAGRTTGSPLDPTGQHASATRCPSVFDLVRSRANVRCGEAHGLSRMSRMNAM